MRIVMILAGGLLCILWFLGIHFLKMMRTYLVLLEQKVDFKKFIFAYLRTTLVNLVIPFKLGEVYRIGVFSKMTGSIQIGVSSVLVDRFFDTLALILILMPIQLLFPTTVSAVSVLLTVFIIVVIFVFWMFLPAYMYLNKYIIMNRSSKRSMAVLRSLEVSKLAYDYVMKLVRGRYALLILLSFAAWAMEGVLLFAIAKITGAWDGIGVFSEYVSSILSTAHSELNTLYTRFSIIVIAVGTVINGIVVLARYLRNRNRSR